MFESVCEVTVAAVQAADPFALAAALAAVSEDQLGAMSPEQAECVVAATQRVINAMAARQSVAVARYAEQAADAREAQRRAARCARGGPLPLGDPSPVQHAAAALAPILRIAPRTMASRIHAAQTLTGLPRTHAMGWCGDLEPYRVAVITRAARDLDHAQSTEFEARLHHVDIRDLPGTRVKTRATMVAARVAPEPDADDTDTSVAGDQRHVRLGPGDVAGLTHWDALLPADSSLAMWNAVQTLAAGYRAGNPDLTVAQSHADALTDLVLTDVHVTTTATLIIPTVAGADPATVTDAAAGTDAAVPATVPNPSPDSADVPRADPATVLDRTPTRPADPVTHPPAPTVVPPPGCSCGEIQRRSGSWVDVLEPLAHPPVTIHPWWDDERLDPPLQHRYATRLRPVADAAANPHLDYDRHGHIWFIPKPAAGPPVGLLLPAQVNAILANPDTHIRLGTAHPDTGAVNTLDQQTYRPGAALARLIRARDATCRYPGCNTPADRCDLDHITPYPYGSTTPENLHTLCRVHHGFKHHGGWTVTMTPDGVCTWTAPTGHTHTTHPHTIHDDAA